MVGGLKVPQRPLHIVQSVTASTNKPPVAVALSNSKDGLRMAILVAVAALAALVVLVLLTVVAAMETNITQSNFTSSGEFIKVSLTGTVTSSSGLLEIEFSQTGGKQVNVDDVSMSYETGTTTTTTTVSSGGTTTMTATGITTTTSTTSTTMAKGWYLAKPGNDCLTTCSNVACNSTARTAITDSGRMAFVANLLNVTCSAYGVINNTGGAPQIRAGTQCFMPAAGDSGACDYTISNLNVRQVCCCGDESDCPYE